MCVQLIRRPLDDLSVLQLAHLYESHLDYLKTIRQPTQVVKGSTDVIIPTYNSYVLQQYLPNAQLILYPEANHGSFYQARSCSWPALPG